MNFRDFLFSRYMPRDIFASGIVFIVVFWSFGKEW